MEEFSIQALHLCVRVEVMRRSRYPYLLSGVPITWDEIGLGYQEEKRPGAYRGLEKTMRILEDRRGCP